MDTLECPHCGEPMLIHEAESSDEPAMAECPEDGYSEVVRAAEEP